MERFRKRDSDFDAFRAVSIIAVIGIHAAGSGWTWFGKDNGKWNYILTLVIDQIYLFAVPAFFFISGYFLAEKRPLLDKKIPFIIKRLHRIFIPYLAWSIIIILLLQRNLSLSNFLFKLAFGKALGPYYFIIVLTCLTIISPILLWLENKPYGILSIVFLNLISLLSTYFLRIYRVDGLSWWAASIPFTTWIVFYYIGILANTRKLKGLFPWIKDQKYGLYLIFLTLSLSIIEAFVLMSFFGKNSGGNTPIKISSFLYSLAVISYFLQTRKKRDHSNRLILIIGQWSFGIYLIHEMIRGTMSYLLSKNALIYSVQPIQQTIVIATTLLISLFIIFIARKLIGKTTCYKYFGL